MRIRWRNVFMLLFVIAAFGLFISERKAICLLIVQVGDLLPRRDQSFGLDGVVAVLLLVLCVVLAVRLFGLARRDR